MNIISDLLQKFNLDWTVAKKPLSYIFQGKKRISDFFGLVRNDNGNNLGICKGVYQPVQNKDVLKTLLKIGDSFGFTLSKAGYMKDGQKIFFFLENPEPLVIGKDRIIRSIFALNSHDRSSLTAFGCSSMVMSCQNQFNRFYKNAKFQFRHSKATAGKLVDLPFNFQSYLENQQLIEQIFQAFADTKLTSGLTKNLVNHLFNLKKDEKLSTRMENKLKDVYDSINHEIKAKGSNFWGLFNGITYYTNHKTRFNPRNYNAQIESIYTGTGYNLSNKAFDFLSKKLDEVK
jgi:phage/plasmid-like protein (TIGR03299 family)